MANGKTDFMSNKILEWVRGTPSSMADHSNLYVALFTSDVGLDEAMDTVSDGTECVETNYVRVRVDNNFDAIDDATNGRRIRNTAEIDMLGTNTAATSFTVEGWAIVTGPTKGTGTDNVLYYNNDISVPVTAGDSLKFAINALVIEED